MSKDPQQDWISRTIQESAAYADEYVGGSRTLAAQKMFLSEGSSVGVLGVYLVLALILLDVLVVHSRVLSMLAVEVAVALVLVLNPWRLRSHLPLIGSPRKSVALIGWLWLVAVALAILVATR